MIDQTCIGFCASQYESQAALVESHAPDTVVDHKFTPSKIQLAGLNTKHRRFLYVAPKLSALCILTYSDLPHIDSHYISTAGEKELNQESIFFATGVSDARLCLDRSLSDALQSFNVDVLGGPIGSPCKGLLLGRNEINSYALAKGGYSVE